jgi:mono/diheme cytochrome c family protein
MKPRLPWIALLACLPLPAAAQTTSWPDIAPLFAERCVMCHSGESAAAGLRLDTLDGVRAGSARGAVVKPGDPGASELMLRLTGERQPRMPMTGPPFLSDQEIALVERWIAGGLTGGEAPPVAQVQAPRPTAGEPVTWTHVAPLFARHCARCHTDDGQMGPPPEGYRLTSHATTLAADERVRVVPGNPAASELLRRIKGQARPRMPFDGPPWLDAADVALIEAWIAQGARDAQGRPAPIPAGAKLRLQGRLDADGRVDGLAFSRGPGMRIDKKLGPGDAIRLEGRIDAEGDVVAERLKRR